MKKIPFFKQKFPEESIALILENVEKTLRSGRLIFGENVREFEDAFAKKVGTKYAVSVNSCTTALMICLEYYNPLKKKVLLPSATFITTANSVLFTGADAGFLENRPGSLEVDFDDLKEKAEGDVVGVIIVHLLGYISDKIEDIKSFCSKNNLFLIEDSAHALGASYKGTNAGAFGEAGCFSFFATKHVSSGGAGGMITTNDKDLVDFALKKRLFGKNGKTGEIEYFGNDWFLDEIRAAIGNAHLLYLDENLSLREKAANKYNQAFNEFKKLNTFSPLKETVPSHYQYAVLLDLELDRDLLIEKLLKKYGIESKNIYLPCHQEKIFRDLPAYKDLSLPATEDTLSRSLTLPLFPEISDDDLNYVIDAMKQEVG